MESLKARLGKLLRAHRTRVGLTQEELATDSDVDRTYISLLERGKKMPTVKVVFDICKALDISPSAFIRELEKSN